MRTVTQQGLNQLAVTGTKVRKITEIAKPAPIIPDHSSQLASLEQRTDRNLSRTEELAQSSAAAIDKQRRIIENLFVQIHQLKDRLENRKAPSRMGVNRGPSGLIETVTMGNLTFKFNRRSLGSMAGPVETIDVLQTKT